MRSLPQSPSALLGRILADLTGSEGRGTSARSAQTSACVLIEIQREERHPEIEERAISSTVGSGPLLVSDWARIEREGMARRIINLEHQILRAFAIEGSTGRGVAHVAAISSESYLPVVFR